MKIGDRRQRNIIFAFCILLLFLSAPLTMDYMVASDRLSLYFLDIPGVRGPFLWLPVWLNRAGASVGSCCRLFILAANVGALAGSCYCFSKISGNVYAGLAGGFCYSFSLYSVYVRYTRGSLGEMTAFVFLPFVFYGLWGLYHSDTSGKGYFRWALPAGLGLFCIGVSHIPTAMITAGFVALTALLLFRRTFRKRTFAALMAACIPALLASAFCWVPYWEGMITGGVYADPAAGADFADRSLSLAQLLIPFLGRNRNLETPAGVQEYCGLGMPFLGIGAAWLVWVLVDRDRKYAEAKRTMGFLVGMSAVSVFFASEQMPWRQVAELHWFPRVLLEHVGYPFRFTVVAALLLSAAVSLAGSIVWRRGRKAMAVFLLIVTAANVLSGVYLMDAQIYTSEKVTSFEAEERYAGVDYLFYLGE